MKKLTMFLGMLSMTVVMLAQIPYFAGTAGTGNMYGYTSMKFRPGTNAQETYTTFQYGVSDDIAIGVDQYTGVGCNYFGYSFRAKLMSSDYFNLGVQFTPSFDVNNGHEFSYLTTGIYINGTIHENLFYVSNTWYGVNMGAENTITNWWYLGYYIPLTETWSITPMAGIIHSWKFDSEVNPAVGAYLTHKKFNFYVWGDQFLNTPRIVIGADFKMD